MGAGKWVDGERPRPPFNPELVEAYLRELALDLKISQRTDDEVEAVFQHLSGYCLRLARQIDPAPSEAALAYLRRSMRRALAGKTAEAR